MSYEQTKREYLAVAIELAKIGGPYRSFPGTGGIWAGHNEQFPDADFRDWGLARATAIILNAIIDGQLIIKE